MKAGLLACALLTLAIGCGSDDDAPEGGAESANPSAAGGAAAEEDLWAPYVAPRTAAASNAGEPATPPDPDSVAALHQKACSRDVSSVACRTLHRQLELVFLDDLVGLRAAGQPLEREWMRTAASARNPHLACFGLRELLYAGKLTAEEDALFVAALDNPWVGPRNFAITFASKLAYESASGAARLNELLVRAGGGGGTGIEVDLCLESRRDPEPNPGLAGRYPGARYRPFASDPDLRWFTTPDSPEKVLAFLTRGGKPAQTADELKAAQQAELLAESEKIFVNAGPDDDVTLPVIELQFRAGRDWRLPVDGLEGVGEIRYVMITPNQAIAVFRDDVLDATSIVASRPPVFDPKAFGL